MTFRQSKKTEKVVTTVRMPKELRDRLTAIANAQNKSVSRLLVEIVNRGISSSY